MALWTGLGQAATVAQLVGADVGGLISMTMQAALTARQNRAECEQLARRVLMIAQLLPHVQEPEAAQPLAGLGDALRDAHELVVSCKGRSAAYQFVMASRTAEKFREVRSKIDSYLILFRVISHIGMTRRLGRIYNVLVPEDFSRVEPSPLPRQYVQLQYKLIAQKMQKLICVFRDEPYLSQLICGLFFRCLQRLLRRYYLMEPRNSRSWSWRLPPITSPLTP